MHNYTVSSWFNYLASHLAVPAYDWVLEGFEPLISDLGKGQRFKPLSHRTEGAAGGNCINSLPAVKSTTHYGVCAVPYLTFNPFELFLTWKINK